MRYVKKIGLAGVPGVVLNERDRRNLSSFFGQTYRPSGLGAASCANCGVTSLDRGLAAEVAAKLGSQELVDAIKDPSKSKLLESASVLAAATAEAMKFRKRDGFAVLAGITSPAFAQVVQKTRRKLDREGQQGVMAALVIVYLTGAIDDACGRRTGLARDYRKASRDLQEALRSVTGPRLSGLGEIISSGGSKLPEVAVWNLSGGLGFKWGSKYTDPKLTKSGASEWKEAAPAGAAPTTDPQGRFWPPARPKKTGDLGTALVAPDAIDFVPFDAVVNTLWNMTGDFRGWSQSSLKAKPTDPTVQIVAWIIRFADDATLASVKRANHDENRFKGNIAWLTLARRYGTTVPSRENDASAFEKHAAKMMALAAKQAVARTGQTGSYNSDGIWVPDPKSETEQVPTGAEAIKYVGVWDKLTIDPKPRPESIFLAQEEYQKAYRKEPTLHALNWYGSFGYGIDKFADYFGFRVAARNQNAEYRLRVSKLEPLRTAGAAVPPQDAQNNSNVFLSVFNAMGPGLSVVLDAINNAVKVASETLCSIFKVLTGPDLGGVLCAIFDAVLKLISGSVKGGIAALFAVGKALLGFIGKLSSGDWMGALYELFTGVNTAVIFVIGGPIADWLGVPFLKAEEKGNPASVDFVPSMERMGEELTKKNPLFLVMLTINVLALIFTPSTASAAALVITLTPILAMVAAPPLGRALRSTKDAWLEKYRTLVNADVQRAVEALLKMISSIIIGAMTLNDAMTVVAERMGKWAEQQGGVGPATVRTVQFFVTNLYDRMGSIVATSTAMMTSTKGFELKALTDQIVGLMTDFLALIPVFAQETGVFDKEGMSAANLIAATGASTVEQAYAAFTAVSANLDAQAQYQLAQQIAASRPKPPPGAGKAPQSYTSPSTGVDKLIGKPATNYGLLATFAAAGVVLGFLVGATARKA